MRKLAFLLVLALLLTGCGGQEVPEVPEFTREEFLEDYDRLWEDLEENYPFFPVLEEMGVDVAEVRESYRRNVEKTNDLETFMDVLNRMFSGRLQSFAHLMLFSRDNYDMMQTGLEEIEGIDAWKAMLEEPGTARVYASLPQSKSTDAGEAPAVECGYYPELSAAYFRFPTMDIYAMDRDEGVISDYLAKLPEVEHIIIDIRGNPGGTSLYWENVIMAPFGGNWQAGYRIFYQDSPINEAFYSGEELLPISPEEMPEFARELGASLYREAEWEADFGEPAMTNGANARRWVVTDGGYSAAESFAAICKLSGWATLVGKPTRGDGLGGNPLLIRLKNTGLLVYLTTAMAENPDGTLNAAQGVMPDRVLLPKDTRDPLELCLDLIREE